MFYCLRLLFSDLDIVERNHIVGANHEIEVIAEAEARGEDLERLVKLESNLLCLATLQEQECEFGRADLYGKTCLRGVDSNSQDLRATAM